MASHCVIEEVVDTPDLAAYDKQLGDLLVKGCDGDTKQAHNRVLEAGSRSVYCPWIMARNLDGLRARLGRW